MFGFGGYGGGMSGRLLIGLVVAAIGLFSYFAIPKKTNQYTGREQRIGLTKDQEIQLGLQAAPSIARQMGTREVPADTPLAQSVRRVGERIANHPKVRASGYPFKFTVLDDPKTVNAFAFPGGPVFVTRALLDRMTREDQLAGVLGHEIGHVLGRHSAEQMAKAQLGNKLSIAAGVAASDYNGHAGAVAAVANQMLQLKYSRDHETESDELGMELMHAAGYDPVGMLEVMEILKKASGGAARQSEFLMSHPAPDTRIRNIQRFLKEKYGKTVDPGRGMGGPQGD